MIPYSGATPRTPTVVCRVPHDTVNESRYSGLTYFTNPCSATSGTSSTFRRIRRPARSPPACMLVWPPRSTPTPSEKALRKP